MQKARDVLQIPVPRIVGWSAYSHNPVGSEYILMEEATGTQLATQWDDLNPEAKLAMMRKVVAIETKMLSVSFSQYVLHLHLHFYMLTFCVLATGAYTSRAMRSKARCRLKSQAGFLLN